MFKPPAPAAVRRGKSNCGDRSLGPADRGTGRCRGTPSAHTGQHVASAWRCIYGSMHACIQSPALPVRSPLSAMNQPGREGAGRLRRVGCRYLPQCRAAAQHGCFVQRIASALAVLCDRALAACRARMWLRPQALLGPGARRGGRHCGCSARLSEAITALRHAATTLGPPGRAFSLQPWADPRLAIYEHSASHHNFQEQAAGPQTHRLCRRPRRPSCCGTAASQPSQVRAAGAGIGCTLRILHISLILMPPSCRRPLLPPS